jgi:hypothetical protein
MAADCWAQEYTPAVYYEDFWRMVILNACLRLILFFEKGEVDSHWQMKIPIWWTLQSFQKSRKKMPNLSAVFVVRKILSRT